MNWIRKAKRYRIYARDGWRCVWCRKALYATEAGALTGPHACLPSNSRALATLDHVLPRGSGGSNHESNLVSACLSCNDKRGTRSAIDFAFSGELVRPAHVVLDHVTNAMGSELPAAAAHLKATA
jgi:5-methylcytosine-specific restriction endonuclease McrA